MLTRALLILHAVLLAGLIMAAPGASAAPLLVDRALAVAGDQPHFPSHAAAQPVALPDDWARTRPYAGGSIWYRVRFDMSAAQADDLLALYVERACGDLVVDLNGQRIYSSERSKPATRNCAYPQMATLPTVLLKAHDNLLDLRVHGPELHQVATRERAGGLSALKIGWQADLAGESASRLFWNVTAVQIADVMLLALGCFMLGLYWMNRGEAYLLYFGGLAIGWAVLAARVWWPQLPLDSRSAELLGASAAAPVVACAVQFLLARVQRQSRWIAVALLLQCVALPLSLWAVGPDRLFASASAWYVLLGTELLAVIGLYLASLWQTQRSDFAPMLLLLGAFAALMSYELALNRQLLPLPQIRLLHVAVPLLMLVIGSRLLQVFAHALQQAEANRSNLEARVKEAAAEIERNFLQLSELRVEQVTEKERKRIAADLHDDLGAKLLTIVHTSESDRISTLAREALEEMRLSVRGLTGKPVRLADALADWRAEVVSRLGQANIEADWRGPAEEIEHLLPARAYVQTTRILREAVSNIIKHSGASHCKVRSSVGEREFAILVQDNGKGIPMELDGKLDRGHGMASMKHRAKQLQGQCLVESGPGYGTVIRLTLPL